MIFAVIVCTGLIGSLYIRNAGQKNTARMIAHQELLINHMLKLGPDSEWAKALSLFATMSANNELGVTWSTRFIPVGESGQDSFESAAIRELASGTDDVWRESWRGVTRYVHAVRADARCLTCHPVNGQGKRVNPNDVIWLISIQFAQQPARSGGSIAMNTGIN